MRCGGDSRAAVKVTAVPAQQEDNFAALDSPSLQFLPRHEEAPGWRMQSDPIVIPGAKLDRHLDREAQHFQSYEAIDATIGKYSSTAGGGFASVEMFRFPDFVKAFGAYSTRKSIAVRYLDIPNEAFVSKHAVHLWRGPFYIRVMGAGPADGNESLQRLLLSVVEKMPAAPGKPAVFTFFPSDVRVPNSERFSAATGFGQKFLGQSFQATFLGGKDAVDGLIIPAANKQAAAKIIDSYRALYVRNGKLLDSIPNLGEDNFTAEDKFLGRAVAFRLDRFVIAFNGYTDRQKLVDLAIATDARILGSIRKQLVRAEEEPSVRPSNAPGWVGRRTN